MNLSLIPRLFCVLLQSLARVLFPTQPTTARVRSRKTSAGRITGRFLWTIIRYILFHWLQILFNIAHYVELVLDGTQSQIEARQLPGNSYHDKAQVLEIVAKYKLDPLVLSNHLSDFIVRHAGFADPVKILEDNLSLYDLTETKAIFVEVPVGVEVWQSTCDAFHAHAQLHHAVRVYVLPIESLHDIADKLSDPERLIFITNTARCGSTLMCRIFEETGRFVAVSEPQALNTLVAYRGTTDDPWLQKHARTAVRIICKPTRQGLTSYALKLTATSISLIPMLRKLYPTAKLLFMYRNSYPVARSLIRTWQELPMGYMGIVVGRLLPWIYNYFLNRTKFFEEVKEAGFRNLVPGYSQAVFLWANFIDYYRKYRNQGIPIGGIKYEDLVRRPEYAINKIFIFCVIPLDLVKAALVAMETDAQAHSRISIQNLRHYEIPEVSEQGLIQIEQICRFYKVPELGEECILEGTITGGDRVETVDS